MGGVFTVYEGSAFECFGREISLRNSDFTSIDKPVGGCNSDQISISGRGLSYDNTNNCYTSQLNITLSEGVTEKTITCAVDHGPGGQQNSIGNRTIAISTSIKLIITIFPQILLITVRSDTILWHLAI